MRNWCKLLLLSVVILCDASYVFCAEHVSVSASSLPITFESNLGQAPSSYRFVSRHNEVEALFSTNGVDMKLGQKIQTQIRFRLLDSISGVSPQGLKPSIGVSNYLIGNDPSRWVRGVPHQGEVAYRNIYSGIDLVFHGSGGNMEHDFRIAPYADPSQVRFSLEGADQIGLNTAGDLEILLSGGKLIFKKPISYQQHSGERREIKSSFELLKDGSVRFRVGPYAKNQELVIDPVFVFSSYLAGNTADDPAAVTTDPSGNIYVTGYTISSDFPIQNGLQTTLNGSPTVFVSKLDPTGHTLLYSTYLGGTSRNYGNAIGVDANGNIVVAGTSSSNDFPHVGALPAITCEGNNDCYFLASIKPNGSAFNYAGLVGGIEGTAVQTGQSGNGTIAIDTAGNAYLAGITDSSAFRLTAGTLATSVPGYPFNSPFVLKVGAGGALLYSTIIPGTAVPDITVYLNNVFVPTGISVDANGLVTIAGTAGPGLPTTLGVVGAAFPVTTVQNSSAGFVLKLNATASAVTYATYLPGTNSVGGLAVDGTGNSYVAGSTAESFLPVSSNAYQKVIKAGKNCTCDSGFVMKLNPTGSSILAATYLEGVPSDTNAGTELSGIAIDSHSNIYLGGMTGSTSFPMVNPFVTYWTYGSFLGDMVIAEMNSDLSSLLFGSLLSSTDQVFAASEFSAIVVDHQDHPIIVGKTSATDFPTTTGSFQTVPPTQARHGFMAKLDMATPAPSVCVDSFTVDFGQVSAKQTGTKILQLKNCGNAPLSVTSFVSSEPTVTVQQSCATVAAGATCPVSLLYKPIESGLMGGTLTINDNSVISPQVVQFTGQGVAPQLSPSSGTVTFGSLLVNTAGLPNAIFFQNTGSALLTVSAVSITGDYSITQNTCTGIVGEGSFCVVSVVFSPTAAGARPGILTVSSNDPLFPQSVLALTGNGDSAYPVPSITTLGSPTANVNTAPATLRVYGANFYPASVVMVKGLPQTTTYVNGEELDATLTSAITSDIGEVQVTVANPIPGGGTSATVTLTRYRELDIDAVAVTSVPGSDLLYASISSTATTNLNTVIPIDPANGTLGTPIPVGHGPTLLAPSSDGSYLFVVLRDDQKVQRINLSTAAVDRTFAFPPDPYCDQCTQMAFDIKGVPSSKENFVLAMGNVIGLYNDQGLVNYVPSSSFAFSPTFSGFAFAGSPLKIYSLPFTLVQDGFFNIFTIGDQGLGYTPITGSNVGGNNTTGAQVVSDGNLLYTSAGQVWNPGTRTQVGSFPVTAYNLADSMLLDSSYGQLFVIADQPYLGSSSVVLSAYNPTTFALNGTLAFPSAGVNPQSLSRWGQTGLAFVAPAPNSIIEALYLVKSSLANIPGKNPLPHLARLTPASAPKGTGSLSLTVSGQGFMNGSVAKWNGAALVTTFVSTSSITATVPASDLAALGTASVGVTNPTPGGGNSNLASFTITGPAPIISLAPSSLTFADQMVSSHGDPQSIMVSNVGSEPLTITGVSFTGTGAASFQQTNTCQTSLSPGDNCQVSITFSPTESGSQTANLIFADNASGSPQSLAISGKGLDVGISVAPGGSTSATVNAGTTASYQLMIGGGGLSGSASVTCTGAPTGATCIVPATINLNATSPAPLTITVKTTPRTQGALFFGSSLGFSLATLLAGLLLIPGSRKSKISYRWREGLPIVLLIGLCSCGGGGAPNNTPPPSGGTLAGQYTLNVTAALGSNSQALPLKLTVN